MRGRLTSVPSQGCLELVLPNSAAVLRIRSRHIHLIVTSEGNCSTKWITKERKSGTGLAATTILPAVQAVTCDWIRKLFRALSLRANCPKSRAFLGVHDAARCGLENQIQANRSWQLPTGGRLYHAFWTKLDVQNEWLRGQNHDLHLRGIPRHSTSGDNNA